MATKTISLDLEAYRRLKAAKQKGESFSQTVKRVVRKPFDLDAYAKRIQENPMSKEAVEAVEEHIRFRHIPSKRER